MTQDFWAASGYRLLDRRDGGLACTDAWLAHLAGRAELLPPQDAGPREKAMHSRLESNPRAVVAAETLASIEDPDARGNWAEFLRFRDRLLQFPTIEACYLDLFARPSVDLAPPLVDALVETILRGMLDGAADPWLCRAGEMLFRQQRVSNVGSQVLSADASTLEIFADTGGFGAVGRLLKQHNAVLPEVKMDVLSRENAALYFMREELHGFVLDLTPGREGAQALADVLRRWVGHLAGVPVTISPAGKIEDQRWRWHVGLDVDATAILNALYRGESVAAGDLERLLLLFRLDFNDPRDALPEMAGRPVYLGLACRPDRTLRVKPQNLFLNLPFAPSPGARRG